MDILSFIGLFGGWGMILGAFIMEGGNPAGLLAPTALMIILGGTLGALMTIFPMMEFKHGIMMIKEVFFETKIDQIAIINQMVELAEKARREGILSLESYVHQEGMHPLFSKGLGLAVDGIEVETMREILEREAFLYESQYHVGAEFFEAAGGISPTMGVIGTVLGLISVLSNLSDPSSLGPKIAMAFIATFMGVGFANVMWLPFGGKLKNRAKNLKQCHDLIVQGILSIQAGENPRVIKDKLNLALLEKLHH